MKKATLLIQHLENIYTMTPSYFSSIQQGFIAIHHDEILQVGIGEGWEYVDKDTRILEARSHIAIPAFIDVNCALPQLQIDQIGESLRKLSEQSEQLMRHGTLIANVHLDNTTAPLLQQFSSPVYVDYVDIAMKKGYVSIAPLLTDRSNKAKRFCISSGYPSVDCLDQWLCMKLYATAHPDIEPLQILASSTIQSAKALGLSRVGMLKPKAKANILILEGASFEELCRRFHGDDAMQVIKDGVRRYPYVLI